MATTLTSEELTRFRRRLVERREELGRRILAAQEAAQRALDPSEALDDAAERSEAADSALTLATHLTREQHEIDDALLRMDRGEYGICEACGRPIEIERLEAEPTARLCAADARRADRAHPPSL
jgi:RNA polymerase-binding protein DksA